MKEPKDARIKRLRQRRAELQQQIKAVEESPATPNKEFKINNLKRQIERIDVRLKLLTHGSGA